MLLLWVLLFPLLVRRTSYAFTEHPLTSFEALLLKCNYISENSLNVSLMSQINGKGFR